MKIREILVELYMADCHGQDRTDAVSEAEDKLRNLVLEMVSEPLYKTALAHDVSPMLADYPELEGGYSDGMSTGLYWALNKIDRLFGEE